MSLLVIEIPAISDVAIEIMKRVIDENEKTGVITDTEAGPLRLAAVLSDFFQMASGLEHEKQELEVESITELAHYALDLIDRLSYQLRHLDIHDQRIALSSVFATLAVWFARRGAVLENLKGTADSFANLVNGEQGTDELANLSQLMVEVLNAATDEIKKDKDKSDPWRPWRVINLNSGVAATRSLNIDVMTATFDHMGQALPFDLPAFFADGKMQVSTQNVPQEVCDLMDQYANRWPALLAH